MILCRKALCVLQYNIQTYKIRKITSYIDDFSNKSLLTSSLQEDWSLWLHFCRWNKGPSFHCLSPALVFSRPSSTMQVTFQHGNLIISLPSFLLILGWSWNTTSKAVHDFGVLILLQPPLWLLLLLWPSPSCPKVQLSLKHQALIPQDSRNHSSFPSTWSSFSCKIREHFLWEHFLNLPVWVRFTSR